MRTSRSSVVMPLPVRHALRKLGRDIRDARRRRIPAAIAAQRASISRTTLVKIEKGDPGVAVGIYATVLFVLGLAERLGDLAAPKNDPVGLQLEEENLPQRIRVARRPKRTKDKWWSPVRRSSVCWFDANLLLKAKVAFYLKESLGSSSDLLARFTEALLLNLGKVEMKDLRDMCLRSRP